MTNLFRHLPGQILAGLLVFSLLPLLAAGTMTYTSGRDNVLYHVQTHLESVATLKKQAIDSWSEHLIHTIKWVANDREVLKAMSTVLNPNQLLNKGSVHMLRKRFAQTVELGHVTLIYILDVTTGKIVAASDPEWCGRIRKNSPFFIHGKTGPYISDIFISLPMGRPTMVASAPVRNEAGRLTGVIAAHANLETLNDIMAEREGLSPTTETYLVNKSNLLLTNTVFAPDGAFNKWVFGKITHLALDRQNGSGLFTDYRNIKVVGAYRWLPERKLALIVKQDMDEALAPLNDLKKNIIILATCLFLAVFFFGFVFSKRITTPLAQIVETARQIGRGKQNMYIDITGSSEIMALAAALNKMVKDLKATMVSLEEKNILIKEIHHRVKNNLQMIHSILNLQLRQTTDPHVTEPIRDSQNRIASIAHVHNTLYRSEDLSTVNMREYLSGLADNLIKISGRGRSDVKINYHIDQLVLDLDRVIACGLIVNELVTNALKYAFPENQPGIITIELTKASETQVRLLVSDNGVGIREAEASSQKKLGRELVSLLSEGQLEGRIIT
ncbi:MAG: HAMP domain-containing protein, partial [Desulfobacterales bacterium]|nr:HAMP domain-containing protein [Desulfobacterales bacterium]